MRKSAKTRDLWVACLLLGEKFVDVFSHHRSPCVSSTIFLRQQEKAEMEMWKMKSSIAHAFTTSFSLPRWFVLFFVPRTHANLSQWIHNISKKSESKQKCGVREKYYRNYRFMLLRICTLDWKKIQFHVQLLWNFNFIGSNVNRVEKVLALEIFSGCGMFEIRPTFAPRRKFLRK